MADHYAKHMPLEEDKLTQSDRDHQKRYDVHGTTAIDLVDWHGINGEPDTVLEASSLYVVRRWSGNHEIAGGVEYVTTHPKTIKITMPDYKTYKKAEARHNNRA
jgi:hypothetical protein